MSSQPQPLPMSPGAEPATAEPTDPPNEIRDALSQAIGEHNVILFMKGTPDAPACGFSARTVAALQALEVPFAAVDVLPDPRIRQELSALSEWPTIPQLFVNGELVGERAGEVVGAVCCDRDRSHAARDATATAARAPRTRTSR